MKQLYPILVLIVLGSCTVRKASTSADLGKRFKATPSGLQFVFIKDIHGSRMPVKGDYVEMNVTSSIDDSILYSNQIMNNGLPLELRIPYNDVKNDLVEGILMMTIGDSALFRISVDDIIRRDSDTQSWMRPNTGQMVHYRVSLISIKNAYEVEEEEQALIKERELADEKTITTFLKKNNIQAQKTESGLYYKIEKNGSGARPVAGQKVLVNYTGRTLDGKVFDSNTDTSFHHVQPFSFEYGKGQVVPGWDEGIGYLAVGSKATLILPSRLAYGETKRGPIEPNSILVFEVELLDIK